MSPEKAAELATQVVVAAIQCDKLDASNSQSVGKYYDDMYCQIMTTDKKDEAELLYWRINCQLENSQVQQ